MSTATISRRLLNTLNTVANFAGLRVLSVKEYSRLQTQPIVDHLRLESRQTAIAGTLTAFAGYLVMRDPDYVQSCRISDLAGYLQHPQTLAARVSEVAGKQDEPIDRFMRYYATHFRESNSQWSQDMFVSYVMKRRIGGAFLELGGADGVTHSNTLSLEQFLDWKGVLVEPHPEQFRLLTLARSNKRNQLINCAATPSGSAESLELIDAGQLSTLSNYLTDDLHREHREAATRTYTVKALPIHEILERAHSLDYLSLDVEGPELELLSAIDWKKQSPPFVITVEHNWRTDVISGLRELLTNVGYKEAFPEMDWLRRGDLWFCHEKAGVVL